MSCAVHCPRLHLRLEAGEVLVDCCNGFVAEPGLGLVVVRVRQERCVGVGSVVVCVGEACEEEVD